MLVACQTSGEVDNRIVNTTIQWYSDDLTRILRYLLDGHRLRGLDEVAQMAGSRFFKILTELQSKEDWLQTELLKEIDNGRWCHIEGLGELGLYVCVHVCM